MHTLYWDIPQYNRYAQSGGGQTLQQFNLHTEHVRNLDDLTIAE